MTETDDHLIRQLRDVSDRLAHARAGILTLDPDNLTDCIRTIDNAIVALCVVQPIALTALYACNEQPKFLIRTSQRSSTELARMIEHWVTRHLRLPGYAPRDGGAP